MDKSEGKSRALNYGAITSLVILREPKFASPKERLNYYKLVAKILRGKNHK